MPKKTTRKTTNGKRRRRAKKVDRFSKSEVATVHRMTKRGATMREIASKLGRAPSSIWRHQQTM